MPSLPYALGSLPGTTNQKSSSSTQFQVCYDAGYVCVLCLSLSACKFTSIPSLVEGSSSIRVLYFCLTDAWEDAHNLVVRGPGLWQ